MPSAFSRHASSMTLPIFEQLLAQIEQDMDHAPPKMKQVLEDARTAVQQAERLYKEQVVNVEDE